MTYIQKAKEWLEKMGYNGPHAYEEFRPVRFGAEGFASYLDSHEQQENCCGTFTKDGVLVRSCVQPGCKCDCHVEQQKKCCWNCLWHNK